jgi:hypothetical protein
MIFLNQFTRRSFIHSPIVVISNVLVIVGGWNRVFSPSPTLDFHGIHPVISPDLVRSFHCWEFPRPQMWFTHRTFHWRGFLRYGPTPPLFYTICWFWGFQVGLWVGIPLAFHRTQTDIYVPWTTFDLTLDLSTPLYNVGWNWDGSPHHLLVFCTCRISQEKS